MSFPILLNILSQVLVSVSWSAYAFLESLISPYIHRINPFIFIWLKFWLKYISVSIFSQFLWIL